MFKTETHMHTRDVSLCAQIRSGRMVEAYHKAGFNTLCVADHYCRNFFDELGDIPWKDKITIFFSGYYRAKTQAEKCGMNVIFSPEISFVDTPNHYLAYGITREFMDSHEDIYKMTPQQFYEEAKANGIFVVQAHPYRDGVCYPTPECADAMEIFNSNPRHENFDDKCEKCAKENGLYVSAGSDSHRPEDVGLAGLLSENEIKTAQDLIELIKSGKAMIYRGNNETI